MNATPPAERLAARYVLRERIADGGMASVWRAEDEVLARHVALKILHEDLAADPVFLERFRQEAVSAARLSHARIVRVFDTGTDGDLCYIVMELFDGEDLGTVLARGPMDPSRAAWMVACALEGLGHAHEQGLVHRDVKPGNILVGRDDQVKVTDFGVAKAAAGRDMTTTGAILGSARYLSPEQVEGTEADARSDLYAAGVVLYEALTGRPPFEGDSHIATATMRLTGDPLPPRAIRAGISRDLEKVTLRALARDPSARYQTAEEMRRAIGRALGETTGELRPVHTAPRSSRPSPEQAEERGPGFFRSWMLVPLLLLVLAAIAIAAGLVVGSLELGGPLGIRAADEDAPEGGPPASVITIVSVDDFDPPGGDGVENSAEAPLAADGDLQTAWETERYDSAAFGGLKQGVGLLVDLGSVRDIAHLEVRSALSGWTFEIRVADDPAAVLEPSAARASDSGGTEFSVRSGRAVVSLEPFRAQVLLIWITGLVPDGGGFRASVAEITIGEA